MNGPLNIETSFTRNGETIYVETDAWVNHDHTVDMDDLETCLRLTEAGPDSNIVVDADGNSVYVTLTLAERKVVAAKMSEYSAGMRDEPPAPTDFEVL